MTDWDTLLSTALLGTERRKLRWSPDTPDFLRQLDSQDSEHALLMGAAFMAAYRRAGYLPAHDESPLPDAAPDETKPTCSLDSMQHLEIMLNDIGRFQHLLAEWLVVLARRCKRVPHPYLPELFSVAKKDSSLVAPVAAVMGERGRWLAARNTAWRHLAALEPTGQPGLFPELEAVDADNAVKLLKSDSALYETAAGLLAHERRYWPRQVVDAFAERVIKETRRGGGILLYTLLPLAHFPPPPLLDSLIERLRAEPKKGLETFIEVLEFRRNMLQELRRD